MKMAMPSADVRARILQGLGAFYETEKRTYLRTAIAEWASYYHVPVPKIELRRLRKVGEAHILGKTWTENIIALWPPRTWKAMPASRGEWTEAEYISVVLHELAHVLFFVEAEKKADLYSKRFVRKDAK